VNARPLAVHRLRANESEWTPPALMVLDTESTWHETPAGEEHTLRLWASLTTDRRRTAGGLPAMMWGRGATVAELCDEVERRTVGRDTLWIACHNLAFDLGLTRLPQELAARGWRPQTQSLSPASPWLRLGRGSKRLTFVDSFTWLPVRLAVVGELVGIPKPDLPDDDDSAAAWRARCESDVRILSAALLSLMDWWDREHLGRWSLTGPASGWNAMRHRADFPHIVIDPDPEARALERAAIYGGRREAFHIGHLEGGRYSDQDIHGAYPGAARDHPLPVKRAGEFPRLLTDRFRKLPGNLGVIARCTVRGAGAHVPVRIDGEVFYPRGTVSTVLASPEIRRLLEIGADVEIGPGYLYWLSKGYSGWASWVMGLADGLEKGAPAVARVLGKHWSRAVIGKFAQRTSNVEKAGPSPLQGWHIERGWDCDTREGFQVVHMGGECYYVRPGTDADNAFPAVLAFVESYVRCDVDIMLREMPGGRVVQVDTDGVLLEEKEPVDVASWARERLGVDLRVKSTVGEVTILGPQHLWLGSEARLSGVPKDAVPAGDDCYIGRGWPGLLWQLQQTGAAVYTRPLVKVHVRGPYAHRWVLRDGSTRAVTCDVSDGATTVQAPEPVSLGAPLDELETAQHPLLRHLLPAVPRALAVSTTRVATSLRPEGRTEGVDAVAGNLEPHTGVSLAEITGHTLTSGGAGVVCGPRRNMHSRAYSGSEPRPARSAWTRAKSARAPPST
jgi:hypothetical protein